MFASVSRSRLLPMSLPFRYFGAAAVFQLAAWGTLLFFSDDFLSYEGGLGPVFGALHLLTLGVLAMGAVGASLQLLPVATRQPVRTLWAVKLVWWLLVTGVAAFAAATAAYRADLIGAGATLAALALCVYGVLLARNLAGARGMRLVVAHGWGALGCLIALLATGIALVARYEHGIALDYPAFRSAHLTLAAYGFMGLLATGLSSFLLPMLALAPPPVPARAYAVLGLAITAICLGASGQGAAGALVGIAAALGHITLLEGSLRARLRRPLGPPFLLVRVSWICLLASLLLVLGMELGLAPTRAKLLFGTLLVPGWLLTFLLGVLQRILPFLGSVHASTGPGGTPLISALTPIRLLAAHCALHLAALALLLAAAIFGLPVLARAGAGAGLAAAALFSVFYVRVLLKVSSHGNTYPPNQPAPA